MPVIYLSIGSNIEPARNFRHCARALKKHFTKPVWSPVYQSTPVGMTGDDFLNAVVMTDTSATIEQIVHIVGTIENAQGRIRSSNKFTSRTLDIDLLLYGDLAVQTELLELPRPEISSAAHVLVPLVQLAARQLHPANGKTFKALLEELEQQQPGYTTSMTQVSLDFNLDKEQ